jgi:hypothetical protein
MAEFTKTERDRLLAKAWELDARLYPKDEADEPEERERLRLREAYYQALAEYADRLPRVEMSACPFSGEVLKRSFDPWGLDGPWWHKRREVGVEEPSPPASFKVLLGALSLNGRKPSEVRAPVIPGPEVPFVVPRLLGLPGMVAVVSRLEMESGDVAYPVVYYSEEEIPERRLHQFWLKAELWLTLESGQSGWLTANDVWDFDLAPWVESGRLRWIAPGNRDMVVEDGTGGGSCPFIGLRGDRFPQLLAFGTRDLLDLPDGTSIVPYDD